MTGVLTQPDARLKVTFQAHSSQDHSEHCLCSLLPQASHPSIHASLEAKPRSHSSSRTSKRLPLVHFRHLQRETRFPSLRKFLKNLLLGQRTFTSCVGSITQCSPGFLSVKGATSTLLVIFHYPTVPNVNFWKVSFLALIKGSFS